VCGFTQLGTNDHEPLNDTKFIRMTAADNKAVFDVYSICRPTVRQFTLCCPPWIFTSGHPVGNRNFKQTTNGRNRIRIPYSKSILLKRSRVATHDIPSHFKAYNTSFPMHPVLSQINPIHVLTTHFFQIQVYVSGGTGWLVQRLPYRQDSSGLEPGWEKAIFSSSHPTRPALGPTHPPLQ
jgi:hypothetical protein